MLSMKWVGAILIVGGCTWFGFSIAYAYRRKIIILKRLLSLIDYMRCELQYRLTPLPLLCKQASMESDGIIRDIFSRLSEELESQLSPDCACCMDKVLDQFPYLPIVIKNLLCSLSRSLGKFDLNGQLQSLDHVRTECREALEKMTTDQDSRLRSYQTLGICSGAAIVILFV